MRKSPNHLQRSRSRFWRQPQAPLDRALVYSQDSPQCYFRRVCAGRLVQRAEPGEVLLGAEQALDSRGVADPQQAAGQFAALFGDDALQRVRGFSPSEMALPNHPDVAYEFVRTLVDCGLQWVLVQEHILYPLVLRRFADGQRDRIDLP